ncbi:Protein-tyrosine-phosphatase [Kytococcus aerolatus]|uniref:Protein-tyrosine-phosphatase n=2 Tax=Kytococcus aerolatus TaxID=592308 RepID=A0A212THI6_9MICO|nr:protein tyrosine phosphatase [Kytococcus aerolatus]SNC65482.1 Protein-tyrosine-phosphatase [Kytococcus aerolatus]
MTSRPAVMYVCVHNAGRSQMAAAWTRTLGGDRVEVRSSGSQPADAVNPAAVEAMAEVGIDLGAVTPRVLTREDMEASEVVVTMGCGDECPYVPGVRREDWELEDPAGRPVEEVRPVRDEIRRRVEEMLRSLGVEPLPWPRPAERIVTFVCNSNRGKSQMGAGLMRRLAVPGVQVLSAGVAAAPREKGVNDESAESLEAVGATLAGEHPKQLTPQLAAATDVLVVIGGAQPGPELEGHLPADVRRWTVDEPSERGIEGAERMALIRDEIDTQVAALAEELRD